MKHFFCILTTLLSLQAISQTNTEEDCKEKTAEAIADFNNGEFIGYYDYITSELDFDRKYEFFYQAYMYSKYSIYMQFESEGYGECYPKKMDRLVRSKYGIDVYQKSRKKALEIYKNSTRQEMSKILDLSKYYLQTESSPKFIGNDYILQNFLKKHFTYKGKEAANHDFEFRIVTLYIDRNGHITNIKSDTDILKDGFSKNAIIKKLNSFGNFVPAYLIGIPVNAKIDMDL